MKGKWVIFVLTILAFSLFLTHPVKAQDEQPGGSENLSLYTEYPSQVIGIGEDVTINLTLTGGNTDQIVSLETNGLPEGWQATFRGGGKIIQSVYVQPDREASTELRIDLPDDVTSGNYELTVLARGQNTRATLPIQVMIEEKLPPELTFSTDLPTIRGTPNSTFSYDVSLKNDGGEDLNVNLSADVTGNFSATFKLLGKDVTSIPINAGETKRLNIDLRPFGEVQAGTYPFTITAQSENAQASLNLTAEVTGQPDLQIASADGLVSAKAYVGEETQVNLLVQNKGSAPVRGIDMTASPPSGWTVTFDPEEISELSPGKQVEVTASLQPSDKAVNGDYMVTFRARPEEGTSESVEYRITVLTSTLWGLAGIGFIAVAIGVVGITVARFGRR